jgi:hypothetical protein
VPAGGKKARWPRSIQVYRGLSPAPSELVTVAIRAGEGPLWFTPVSPNDFEIGNLGSGESRHDEIAEFSRHGAGRCQEKL